MGVHGKGGDIEAFHADDIGCFATDAGQRGEVVEIAGDAAVMIGGENADQGIEVFGFVAVEAEGADVFFEFVQGTGEKVVKGRVMLKEGLGDNIDLAIGGLGAEDGSHEELKGVGIVEFAVSFGPEVA